MPSDAAPGRLINAASPYLLQHAGNPVDWWPWSDDAFDEARKRDVPVFLSIGYATCHWCHVMAHESFEDPEVGAALNDSFVSIKVDREERPDVDHVYMAVCQLIGGSCGWPLTVLLTPDRKPFYVATYLPRRGRFGRPGLMELIARVDTLWRDDRDSVLASADRIAQAVATRDTLPPPETPAPDVLRAGYSQLVSSLDPVHGGFGSAPKFPTPHNLLFLLRHAGRGSDPAVCERALHTLVRMGDGAIHDQLGFGFHRYATDAEWRLPHFEKMLYDQAMMLRACVEAWQATGDDRVRRLAQRTAEYMLRDLRGPERALYAGEDADSEGEEGRFYVWTEDELREAAGDHFEIAAAWFGTSPEGNFEDEASGRRTGANVLHPGPESAGRLAALGQGSAPAPDVLELVRAKLLEARERRERPIRDEKILTDWNGLAIGALASAGRAFSDPELVAAASEAATFLRTTMVREDGGLRHRYFRGEAGVDGLLDDYASLADGLVDLYQATLDPDWLEWGIDLAGRMIRDFSGPSGGFHLTPVGSRIDLLRPQPFQDGALPSGNAAALSALVRLGHLAGRTDLLEHAQSLIAAAGVLLRTAPGGFAGFLLGVQLGFGPVTEVVLSGDPESDGFQQLREVLDGKSNPGTLVLHRPVEGPGADRIGRLAPYSIPMEAVAGRPTAYVCRGFTCSAPVFNPNDLEEALAAGPSAS